MADGDVPGGTGTGGNATGGDGDEAVWLDLVARFGAPAPEPADGESQPWPDREDLAGPVRVSPNPGPADGPAGDTDALPGEPPTNPTGLPGLPVTPATPMPEWPWPNADGRPKPAGPGGFGPGARGGAGGAAGAGPRDTVAPDDPADEHYIPPVPPPLPKLQAATKLAWIALFGGPLYLLISTALGVSIPGVYAFLAVAAFVGGFVVLILRMDNGRPPDSGSDDGAVV